MKIKDSRSKISKSKSPTPRMRANYSDRKLKEKTSSPMRGLKIKVLDYSPTPSRGVIESNHLIKMQKDVAILKQKENKISKKLKLTQSENSQLLKIKKKTEENIGKQKKLINNQIEKIIEIFVKLVREKSVYLDLGKDYEIKGDDYKYPPDSPVNRNKQGENFELPTHLTASCVLLGNESLSNLHTEDEGETRKPKGAPEKELKPGRSKSKRELSESRNNGKRQRSHLSKSPNPKKTALYNQKFPNKSSHTSRKSLEISNYSKSKSPRKGLKKSVSRDLKKSDGGLKKAKSGKNENLNRCLQMNSHMKKLVLKKTVYMPSTLRALARTAEHKY
jgi:hypothetical protein